MLDSLDFCAAVYGLKKSKSITTVPLKKSFKKDYITYKIKERGTRKAINIRHYVNSLVRSVKSIFFIIVYLTINLFAITGLFLVSFIPY